MRECESETAEMPRRGVCTGISAAMPDPGGSPPLPELGEGVPSLRGGGEGLGGVRAELAGEEVRPRGNALRRQLTP